MNDSTPCDASSGSETGFAFDLDSLAAYFERVQDQRCARAGVTAWHLADARKTSRGNLLKRGLLVKTLFPGAGSLWQIRD